MKLKIAPGWDVEPVRAVRRAHPDLDLHVDANGAYPDDAESAAMLMYYGGDAVDVMLMVLLCARWFRSVRAPAPAASWTA